MRVFLHNRDAHTTLVTMEKIITTSHSANSTPFTVKNFSLFAIISVKNANWTVVASKLLMALLALPRVRLLLLAPETFDSGHFMPFEVMMLLRVHYRLKLLVVAKSARPELASTDWVRTLLHTGT